MGSWQMAKCREIITNGYQYSEKKCYFMYKAAAMLPRRLSVSIACFAQCCNGNGIQLLCIDMMKQITS